MVFSGIEISQNFAFIEDVVSLNINASGYGEIEVTSNNSEIVSVTSVGDGIYEVSATEAVDVNIYVKLKDKNGDATGAFKTANVTFCEHGVKNFDTVEGIKIDTDKSAKVIQVKGEPELKRDLFSDDVKVGEKWYYFSKGVYFSMQDIGDSKLVQSCCFYGFTGSVTYDEVSYNVTKFPYEIGFSLKLSDNNSTMDTVVSELGSPSQKRDYSASTRNNSYLYTNTTQSVRFYFLGDTAEDYAGQKIYAFIIY